ncbi:MAG TPA: hypothetical protein VM938_08650 [Acidimicrobiales bacterium]|nr:hypothetical protein [Acidimicrobiales bacterium]
MAAIVGLPATGPATAHTGVCTFDGVMHLSAGLWHADPFAPSVTTSFNFVYTTGLCTANKNVNTSGTITGWCGMATGTGATASGHAFSLAWNGATMTFSGAFAGAFHVTDIPFDTGDCAQGTARNFTARGTVLKSHTTLPNDVCTGRFRMTLSVPFAGRLVPPRSASFTIQHVSGTCSGSTPISVTGTITGDCYLANGSGTSNSGATATVDWYGHLIGLTGQLIGSAFSTEDPNTPGTCLSGTETQFMLVGTLARI